MMGPSCAIRPDDLQDVRRHRAARQREPVSSSGRRQPLRLADRVVRQRRRRERAGAVPHHWQQSRERRAHREGNSTLYRVTLDKETSDRNGATKRVDIKVARPNVKVFAPPGLTFSMAEGPTTTVPTPAIILRGMADYTDLQIRAAAYVSRDASPDGFKVVAAFEPVDPSVKLGSAAIGLFDSSGQSSARWTGRRSDFARMPVFAGFPVAPGRYRMRVAVVDAAGRAGAVDVPVIASLPKAGSLTLERHGARRHAGRVRAQAPVRRRARSRCLLRDVRRAKPGTTRRSASSSRRPTMGSRSRAHRVRCSDHRQATP